MDDDKKKKVQIGIVVACLILAGVIVFITTNKDGGGDSGSAGQLWLKCRNPKCAAEYQIDQKDYKDGFFAVYSCTKERDIRIWYI